jgi:segregation and condensation protein A
VSATIEEMPLSAVMGEPAPAPESSAEPSAALVAPQAAEAGEASLVVSLGSFEGPIDLLLHLARDQKVDLAQISILQLVEQYLVYIDQAHQLRLEVAADYLVMAAWLAYLKSRLLLPKQEQAAEEAMSGDELAAVLAWQIRRLEAMQKAAADLIALPQMGYNTFVARYAR